jgi:Tfp pilus assembly protein PilF
MTVALAAGTLHAKSPLDKLNPFSWASSKSSDKPDPAPGPTESQKAELQVSVGRSLEREGKLEQAAAIYSDALKKDDHSIEAYQRAAIVNDQLGKFEESDKLYRAALKQEPKNAELLCDRGYSFYLQNRPAEAEKTLLEALAINPRLARAHNNLALVLAHNDRDEQALAQFAQGGCSEADARVNLAFCMMARRDWAMARQEFQRASAAAPNSPAIKNGLAYLRAKAPPQVAETAPTIPAPIAPVPTPAIAKAPSAIVSAPPAPAASPSATAATLTSYETPRSAPATRPSTSAPTTASSELMTLSELMSLAPVPQREQPVLDLAGLAIKPADAAPQPVSRPTPSPPRVVKLVIPEGVSSKPTAQPVPVPAPTADDGLATFYSQPKSEIRIVERTQRLGTVK